MIESVQFRWKIHSQDIYWDWDKLIKHWLQNSHEYLAELYKTNIFTIIWKHCSTHIREYNSLNTSVGGRCFILK